jgi:hypothetical protein
MGKIIDIRDCKAEKLRQKLGGPQNTNIWEFLDEEYGNSLSDANKEMLAMIYRRICELNGEELDPSIMGKPGKRQKALRKFNS